MEDFSLNVFIKCTFNDKEPPKEFTRKCIRILEKPRIYGNSKQLVVFANEIGTFDSNELYFEYFDMSNESWKQGSVEFFN
jgi:hypothetical protein